MKATFQHFNYAGGTIHTQPRAQETPPPKTESKDKSWQRGHTIQYTGDMMIGRLDACTPNIQGAAQPMHEESQVNTGVTLNADYKIPYCS
jgi:hypothetical protein